MNKYIYTGFFLLCVSSPCMTFAATNVAIQPTRALTSQVSKIDLNTADEQILIHSMKGIGLKRARAIIQYREAHQAFKSLEELGEVPGIGKNFVIKQMSLIEQTFTISSKNN